MKSITLHTIHAFPVNRINCDGNGIPKNDNILGQNRIYQSGQCWGRAIKDHYTKTYTKNTSYYNTKKIEELVKDTVTKMGLGESDIDKCVSIITKFITTGKIEDEKKKSGKKPKTNDDQTDTPEVETDTGSEDDTKKDFLIKVTVNSIQKMVNAIMTGEKVNAKILGDCYNNCDDGELITFFGSMNAKNNALNVDSAVNLNFPITTHESYPFENTVSGLDDFATDTKGAGFISSNYVCSGVFYRYLKIDIEHIIDSKMMSSYEHLSNDDIKIKKEKVANLVNSFLTAKPAGSRSKVNGATLPSFVVGSVESGETSYNAADAFAKAVTNDDDVLQNSIDRLTQTLETKDSIFNLSHDVCTVFHDNLVTNNSGFVESKDIKEFIDTLVTTAFA